MESSFQDDPAAQAAAAEASKEVDEESKEAEEKASNSAAESALAVGSASEDEGGINLEPSADELPDYEAMAANNPVFANGRVPSKDPAVRSSSKELPFEMPSELKKEIS